MITDKPTHSTQCWPGEEGTHSGGRSGPSSVQGALSRALRTGARFQWGRGAFLSRGRLVKERTKGQRDFCLCI